MTKQRSFAGETTVATVFIDDLAVWTTISGPPGSTEYVSPTEVYETNYKATEVWKEKCRTFQAVGFDALEEK